MIRKVLAVLLLILGVVLLASVPASRPVETPPSVAAPALAVLPPETGYGFTVSLGTGDGPGESLGDFKRDVDALAAQGQEWVRLGIPSWEVTDLQRPGPLTWNEANLRVYDEGIAYARARGLAVYLITADGRNGQASEQEYRETMREYWTVLARRYATRVSVWQLYNEADGAGFRTFAGLDSLSSEYLSDLGAMLRIGRAAIKAASPETLVTTNASGWPVDDRMQQRWEEYFDAVSPELDVIAVDVYPADDRAAIGGLPDRISGMERRYGKPVIVAEVGLQTCDGCWTEAQQGTYLAAAIEALKAAGPLAILVYQWRDTPDDPANATFGVQRVAHTPKAGFGAVLATMRG